MTKTGLYRDHIIHLPNRLAEYGLLLIAFCHAEHDLQNRTSLLCLGSKAKQLAVFERDIDSPLVIEGSAALDRFGGQSL